MWHWPSPPPLIYPDPYVKVYLLQDGRKMSKKRTAVKKDDPNPVFNEAMIFSVPAIVLQVRGDSAGVGARPRHPLALGPLHPLQPSFPGLLQVLMVCLKPCSQEAFIKHLLDTSPMVDAGDTGTASLVLPGDRQESLQAILFN